MAMRDLKILFDSIVSDPSSGCWNWTKSTREGYGQIKVGDIHWTTHRYAATAIYGEIPKGMVVRHSCNNRRCCNPNHLSIGSHQDNWEDSEVVHRENTDKMRKMGGWNIDGVCYPSSRIAHQKTGISMASLVKYTQSGIFDIETYRKNCERQGKVPKV